MPKDPLQDPLFDARSVIEKLQDPRLRKHVETAAELLAHGVPEAHLAAAHRAALGLPPTDKIDLLSVAGSRLAATDLADIAAKAATSETLLKQAGVLQPNETIASYAAQFRPGTAFDSQLQAFRQWTSASDYQALQRNFDSLMKDMAEAQEAARQLYAGSAAAIELVRASQWSETFRKANEADIAGMYAKLPAALAEIQRFRDSVAGTFVEKLGEYRSQPGVRTAFGDHHEMLATKLRMSAIAAVDLRVELYSPASIQTYEALFGSWSSARTIPEAYWVDQQARVRIYEEAEVDPGLIQAEPGTALEIMIESGLTGGAVIDSGPVAVLSIGSVSLSVRAGSAEEDAYRVVRYFEQRLREHVAAKLLANAGGQWFKHRVDGNIGGKAKETRKKAMQDNESSRPLVEYTDVGDLVQIITSKLNWPLFEPIFRNQAEFRSDMTKIISTRRPTMHTRPIDAVRLVELFVVATRLLRQIDDDGAWAAAADSDR
ncbi:Swt1 family HEPN domain-containing protein [Rhizobium leguminosarum]|uniref:Swt1 family HEPN domain-containing protein n=1 Tax=Rhizobium leguminosarum TaxID=384 RepID=UPI001031C7A9|nr:Swt1 family HEPN domain-containing protein [Rhizobium leguminosarum]TAX38981.1 hypothetical protein ELI05_08435 [Rhizobium leguminosarum]